MGDFKPADNRQKVKHHWQDLNVGNSIHLFSKIQSHIEPYSVMYIIYMCESLDAELGVGESEKKINSFILGNSAVKFLPVLEEQGTRASF